MNHDSQARFIRFTSLVVELIRARPYLIFWTIVLVQAAMWFILPVLLYGSPPGEMATVLAFGREYQVGTHLGPPLAFWLADAAFRFSGNHIFGVYLLSQVCFVVTFWALFSLSRAIVGAQQAVLAVLLSATAIAMAPPGIEFGPMALTYPLWALIVRDAWLIVGQDHRNTWFALSIKAGLLLLTTFAAIPLLLLFMVFMLAIERGRRALMSMEALFALLVIFVLAVPFFVWLMRGDAVVWPALPPVNKLGDRALLWGMLIGGMLPALSGTALLLIFNQRRFDPKPKEASIVHRQPMSSLAREFVYYFGCAPAIVLSLISALIGQENVVGGTGIALLLSGLVFIVMAGDIIYLRRQQALSTIWLAVVIAPMMAVIGTILVLPWIGGNEVKMAFPASAIGEFFGESYERRVGRPLPSVAGDPQIAALIGFAAHGRPDVFLDATPEQTPWLTLAKFNQSGGVVVWRAADTAGSPPTDIQKRFPDLVPEVPRTFERLVRGRQTPLRIGWAIVRPQATN